MPEAIRGALILADESADWIVAGLRQIDRLALALNESLGRLKGSETMPVCILWIGDSRTGRRLPEDRRLTRLSLTGDLKRFSAGMTKGEGSVLVVDSRLLVDRGGFTQILQDENHRKEVPVLLVPPSEIALAMESYSFLRTRIAAAAENSRMAKPSSRNWYYLHGKEEIAYLERELLRGTVKSQDGFVARFINRPISRSVSRIIVRSSLLPNQWTLMITALPLAGAIWLTRGNYFGFALGAVLFQLHSALDGCDGEIARAKYLESETGSKLDGLCDRFTTLLYAVSLGIGLARQPGVAETMRWIYPLEGVMAALLIGVSETWLQRTTIDEDLQRAKPGNTAYPDYVETHRQNFNAGDQLKLWMIKNSGLLFLGDGLTSFFGQATKRDVFNFGFMLLALCGRPSWILHILAICACAIMILALKSLLSPPLNANQARVP